jgi:hypothetical protein
MISNTQIELIEYIYNNFELDWFLLDINKLNGKIINSTYIIYITNKETEEVLKTKFTSSNNKSIKLLTVLHNLCIDIDSYDEIDGSYDTREEEQRLKKTIRREKRALERLLADTGKELKDFIKEMIDLDL